VGWLGRWSRSACIVLRITFYPALALRYAGVASAMLTILGYLGIASVLTYFSGFAGWIKQVPQEWFLVFGAAVFFLLLLNAAVQLHQKVDGYETPQIEIAYNPPSGGISSFYQGYSYEDEHGITVLQLEEFRVAVINRSGKTIEGVKVLLIAFAPQGSANLPYPLRLMDDQSPFHESLNGFRLDRGEIPTRYVNVVSKWYVERPVIPARHILLDHVQPNTGQAIPDGRYELTIIATGQNVPQTPPKQFIVYVDDQGRLHLDAK
jgi:hypothetical protein